MQRRPVSAAAQSYAAVLMAASKGAPSPVIDFTAGVVAGASRRQMNFVSCD